jgi:hypothetical protein
MIKPSNLEDEAKSLLSAKEYEEFVEGLADEKK